MCASVRHLCAAADALPVNGEQIDPAGSMEAQQQLQGLVRTRCVLACLRVRGPGLTTARCAAGRVAEA